MQKNLLATENVYNRLYTKFSIVVGKELNVDLWTDGQTDVAYAVINLSKVMELQCKKEFIKQEKSIESFKESDLITDSDIQELAYTNSPVVFDGFGGTVQLIKRAEAAKV